MQTAFLVGGFLCLNIIGADARPVAVVIEEDRSPSAAPVKSPTPSVEPAREPSVTLGHDDVVGQLHVQSALREAKGLLASRDFARAIARLEPLIDRAEGCSTFLSALETAYRGRIAELMANRKSEQALLLAQRLRILSPQADVPEADRAAPPTQFAAAHTPESAMPVEKPARKPAIEARGKLEQSDEPLLAPLQTAERLFQQERYREALAAYEEAYHRDPKETQVARDRWGYCLLFAAVETYNKFLEKAEPVDSKSWEELEADVKLARQLSPSLVDTDRVLTAIQEQRTSATKPTTTIQHLAPRGDGWQVTATGNFRIYHRDPSLAEKVGRAAEDARAAGMDMWFPGEPTTTWNPACEIYLYPTSQEYTGATGVGPQSPGHSKVVNDQGRIVSRTVALRCDETSMTNAVLPHEVTHVVLAGRFGRHALPRWADEGMAVLTEPRNKQDAHLVNLSKSRQERRGFACAQVMTMRDYPAGGQMLDFYAHSVGICRFLVERHGPQKLVQFLRSALHHGNYEVALKHVYGQSFDELEAEFSNFTAQLAAPTGLASAPR